MKNFLNQFRAHLSPLQLVMFESFIFGMADKMVEGYNGGKWNSVQMGKTWGLTLPVNGDANGRVRIETPFGNATVTDHKTASAIFTFLVLSWYFEKVYERLTPAGFAAFDTAKMQMGDFVRNKKNGYNTRDFFNLTD
jgi:hypothetical protein